jgi:hypothetical protein
MMVDVTNIFAAHLARNRGPVIGDPERRQAPNYGVLADFREGVINVLLSFRRGSAYCCFEHGCHLPLFAGKRWEWLRRELAACGLNLSPRLELHLQAVVEEGALFFDFSRPEPSPRGRGWYAFAPFPVTHYETTILEAEHLGEEVTPDYRV